MLYKVTNFLATEQAFAFVYREVLRSISSAEGACAKRKAGMSTKSSWLFCSDFFYFIFIAILFPIKFSIKNYINFTMEYRCLTITKKKSTGLLPVHCCHYTFISAYLDLYVQIH